MSQIETEPSGGKTIPLVVNGQTTALASAFATLADLLVARGLNPQQTGVAVAVNETVVPRSRWAQVALKAHDRIDIVGAVQGG